MLFNFRGVGNLMKKEKLINKDISDKINNLNEPDNVKKFLIKALIWEYDNIDEKSLK